MKYPDSLKRLASRLGVVVGTATLSVAAFSQAPELTPEEQEKLHKLTAFLESVNEFLPTVNRVDVSSLPITMSYRDVLDHVVVDVAVGDGEALPFMFDTGAPTYITKEISEANPGEVVIETVGAAGGGKLIWSPLERLSSMAVEGKLSIEDPTVQIGWEPDSGLYCITPHGLLGAPAMRNAVWQVNYGTGEITVAASADQLDHIDGAIELPFSVKPKTLSPSPQVELGVGNGTLTFLVDTGGGIPLTINTKDLASVGVEVPANAPVSVNLAGGAGGTFEIKLAGLQLPVNVGGRQINTTVFVGDGMAPTTAGNMGHMFLKNFVVTFDWSQNKMFLDPLAEDGSVEPMSDAKAAGIGLQNGSVIINSLALGGPADKAGLKLGDIVTRVDGNSVEDIALDDYCELLKTQPQSVTTAAGKTYDIGTIKGFLTGQ
ncbi:PDZ domain-containing protein [Parahaliea maris]|uniref:PDZ domain-containing protein n=1 Tax=Parahaliea maris TaxID=2716870 RepID=A0A5C8ZQK3_9GAMM|nr:PDZ domain-containing protein [Parahaliea maris]TXS90776.1 PDZ domain-containing protein [Parahaliea maris]